MCWESNLAKRVKMTINSEAEKGAGVFGETRNVPQTILQYEPREPSAQPWRVYVWWFIYDLFTLSIYAENYFSSLADFFLLSSDTGESDDKSTADSKKRRKNKVHEIKEESQITNDFAQHLDLSCMSKGLVKAPSINNGFIAKYNRWMRRAEERICWWFLSVWRTKKLLQQASRKKDYLKQDSNYG